MVQSRISFPLASVRQFLRDWRARRAGSGELNIFTKDELALMGTDVDLSWTDLRSLSARGPHAADLIPRRISSLGLEPDALDTSMLRDMQRLCTFCQSKGRCIRDLDQHPPAWPSYCPNNFSLRTVVTEQEARFAE